MSGKQLQAKQRDIVLLVAISEMVLAAIFFVWQWYHGLALFPVMPSSVHLLEGAVHAGVLFAVNIFVLSVIVRRSREDSSFRHFIDCVVHPLAAELSLLAALVVSVFAGIGEELFFRGVLQSELGLLVASVLFAVLHFGTALKRYPVVVCFYFLIGLYIGVVFEENGSLWTVILMHALYDFLALVYLRFCYSPVSASLPK